MFIFYVAAVDEIYCCVCDLKRGFKLEKNKQFVINMTAQVVGFVVNIGISFLLTPFIVKSVGSESFGFVGLANNFVSYAQVITVALNSMAGRFITIKIHENNIEESKKYFTSIVFANIITAFILTLPSVMIILNLNKIVNVSDGIIFDVQLLWAFIFFNFLIGIVSATYGVAIFVRNKLYLSSVQGIISNMLRVGILIVAFSFYKPAIWYVGLASFSATLYICIWNLHYTKKLLPEVKVKIEYFDINVIKVLLSSGIWNSFSRLSSILSTGLDLLITNLYVGSVAMGILSVAKTVPNAILALFGSLASVYAPQLTISYAEKNYEDMRNQLMSSIKLLGMFASIPVAVLLAYGDIFYSLWVPSQDTRLLYVLTLLSCIEFIFVLPLEGLWNLFTATNNVKQASLYMFFNSILTIIIVLLSLQFTGDPNIKLYIIAGTSTGFAVVRSLIFLPMYGAHCLKFKWNIFYPTIMKNTVAVIIATLFSLLLRNIFNIETWVMLIFLCILTSVFSVTLNFVLLLDENEKKNFLKKLLRRN